MLDTKCARIPFTATEAYAGSALCFAPDHSLRAFGNRYSKRPALMPRPFKRAWVELDLIGNLQRWVRKHFDDGVERAVITETARSWNRRLGHKTVAGKVETAAMTIKHASP